MGAGKSIMQSEDSKNKLNVGVIDTSKACESDVICPPTDKFTNKYYNDDNNDNLDIKYLIIFLLLLIFSTSIYLFKQKYI